MAEFHEIGSSQFTEVTPTGTEQIQISATQKTTLQKIANLFKGKADPNSLVITDFNDSAPFSDGTQDTKVKFFVANAATVVNGPSNTGITSGSYYGIAITSGLMPTMGRVEYLLWVQGKKTLFRGYKVYVGGAVSAGSGWEEVSGGRSLSDLRISDWSDITKYGDVQDPYIQDGDTLVGALRKLQWMAGNNTVKTFGDSSGIGMIWWDGDTQSDLFTAFYFMIETSEIYFLFEGTFSDLGDQATEDQIIGYIKNKGSVVYIGTTSLINYTSGTTTVRNLRGKESLWYTGSENPTLTIVESSFNDLAPTASFICAYNITPIFDTQSSITPSKPSKQKGDIISVSMIHMHQNAADVAPISGYKVYTILCQVVGSVKHFFINVAPYN
nr:hypothetical protein [uncultured Dysosmobacter sp.]